MKHRDGILDLVRGVSALLVMLGHLRGFLFMHFGELAHAGKLTKFFYFATGLGHQAVMVFFVLSGFFVGGSVLSGIGKGSFTWHGYAASRLTRLWMVLLPALLLTLCIDLLGHHWSPGAYSGGYRDYFNSGPSPDQPAAWDTVTWLGNVFFLQTVSVPVFGTNGPLWSLANEFWYYLMFPLCASGIHAFFRKRLGLGLGLLAASAILGCCLPGGLVASGLIWLLGAGVWWMRKRGLGGTSVGHGSSGTPLSSQGDETIKVNEKERAMVPHIFCLIAGFMRGWLWRVLLGMLFLATLAASKTGHWLGSDYSVGIAFAMWMLALPGTTRLPSLLHRAVTGLSEISYTLYVVHFPLLFFVSAVLFLGRRFPANSAGYLWFTVLAATILVVATGIWWLFERNTDTVRKWIMKRLIGAK